MSVDSPIISREVRDGIGATFPFLCDSDRNIIRELDIVDATDAVHGPVAIPYTFLLDRDLSIYKIYNGYWYWGRPSIAELQQDAREVTRRIRPDWKIDTPQMREKWGRGEKKAFFPYGKSLRQVLVRMSNAVDQFE